MAHEGFSVVAMGDAPWHDLNFDLQRHLSGYATLSLDCYAGKARFDESRYDAIHRTVARFVAEHGRLAGLESFNEYWLPLEARLREDFNVPGPRPAELACLIHKSKMKEVFRKAGATVVRGEILRDREHLLKFRRDEGVIVVKPDIGVGASDTHKISNDAEAETFWSRRDVNTEYFIERFIAGPDRELLSFDGIADDNGDVAYATVHPCNEGLLEIVQGGTLAYHCLRQIDIPRPLREIGPKVVKAFGLRRRFFHIEFFRVGTTYYALEMNARPPGVLTLDMNNHAYGVDLWAAYARLAKGVTGPVPLARDLICAYVARVNRVRYRHTHDEVVSRLGDRLVFATPMDSPIMGDFAYLVLAPDHETRRELTEMITATA